VVRSRQWPSLASLLSLTKTELEEVKKEELRLPHQDRALLMLKEWVKRDTATIGQLYENFKDITVFHYS